MMKTQVIFIFDDGFKKSVLRIADIFEEYGLSASFAVLANPDGFLDEFPKGDFSLWNELQSRGHDVVPHGYDHTDLSAIPFEEAREKIDACLDAFGKNLHGFKASATFYPTTYNRTTPEVDAYLLTRVRAIRTCGRNGKASDGLNGGQHVESRCFTSAWHGPECCDDHLLECLRNAHHSEAPLFLYMMHGLDDEGWGPITDAGLRSALNFVRQSEQLCYQSLGQFTKTLES